MLNVFSWSWHDWTAIGLVAAAIGYAAWRVAAQLRGPSARCSAACSTCPTRKVVREPDTIVPLDRLTASTRQMRASKREETRQ